MTRNICLVKICLRLKKALSPDGPSNVTVLKFQLKRQQYLRKYFSELLKGIVIKAIYVNFQRIFFSFSEQLRWGICMKTQAVKPPGNQS